MRDEYDSVRQRYQPNDCEVKKKTMLCFAEVCNIPKNVILSLLIIFQFMQTCYPDDFFLWIFHRHRNWRGRRRGDKNRRFNIKKNNSTPSLSICFWRWWFHLIRFHLELQIKTIKVIDDFTFFCHYDVRPFVCTASIWREIPFCPMCTVYPFLPNMYYNFDFVCLVRKDRFPGTSGDLFRR